MHIIIFGDSIGQGFFDTKQGGWATLLSMCLQRETIESDYERYNSVFNLSISGENTTEITSRLKPELPARLSSKKKNILIFAAGINDAKRLLPSNELYVPIEVTKENIERFVQHAQQSVDQIFIIGLTRVDERYTTEYNADAFLNKDIEEYDQMIKAFADDNQIVYIPTADLISEDCLEDGLHPNAKGHRLIFERVKETLEEADLL